MKTSSSIVLATLLMVSSASAATTVQLAGPPWQLETIAGTLVEATSAPTMHIGKDDGVTGNGGCNTFSGSAIVGEQTLTFERLMSTNRACEHSGLERSYFDALAATATYRLEDDRLTLLGADGSDLATLRVVYVN